MKGFFSVIFVALLINMQLLTAQTINNGTGEPSKMSPLTTMLVNELRTDKKASTLLSGDSHIIGNFGLNEINEVVYAGALAKVGQDVDQAALEAAGVLIGTKAGKIWSMQIPANFIDDIVNVSGIEYIQIDEPITQCMDAARTMTRADIVQTNQGNQLDKAYTGKGVVVGVIDGGFDFTHPNFYDKTGNNYRLKRVWLQAQSGGSSPSGFGYGVELDTEDEIMEVMGDVRSSHGTHVAGIAAGSGLGTDGLYTGMAPEADLVFVPVRGNSDVYTTGQSYVLDAVKYIFNYATSVGKPAVINISLGVHIGPHDGTSLFDQGCDALVDDGKIICSSAGNTGNVALHLSHNCTQSKPGVSTVMNFLYGAQYGYVDIWGSEGETYEISIAIVDNNSLQIVDQSPYYSTAHNVQQQDQVLDNDGGGTAFNMITENASFNGKPRMFFYCSNQTQHHIVIMVRGSGGTVHMWNAGGGGSSSAAFTKEGISFTTAGNTNCTTGEIGGSGKSTISVGAYTSKTSYTNIYDKKGYAPYSNGLGKIAKFSSHGPTADGRMKPDICGPGNVVVSSVSHFDETEFATTGSSRNSLVTYYSNGSVNWYWAATQGTSMSCPAVTGIVALMLQKDPYLDRDEIVKIFSETAIEDDGTGNIPAAGSNIWGWGKVDALAALRGINSSSIPKSQIYGNVNVCETQEAEYTTEIPEGVYFKWLIEGGRILNSRKDTTIQVVWEDPGTGYLRLERLYNSVRDTMERSITINPAAETPVITEKKGKLYSSANVDNQWYFEGIELTGETGRSMEPTIDGNYTVRVEKTTSCSSRMSEEYHFVADTTSVRDISENDMINVFPSPADLFVTVSAPCGGKYNITLIDLLGQKLVALTGTGNIEEKIGLTQLSAGTYIMIIDLNGQIYRTKLIVNHR